MFLVPIKYVSNKYSKTVNMFPISLQCFDAVGWQTGNVGLLEFIGVCTQTW